MAKWASDEDASSLLAGILDETADDAAEEELKLQESIETKLADERAREESAEETKRAHAAARISAELDRQSEMNQRRTAKMEALKVEELKAAGTWVDPKVLARKQAEAEAQRLRDEALLQAAMQPKAEPVQAQPMIAAEIPAPRRRPIGAIAALFVGVIGAVGLTVGLTQTGYQLDQTSYAKAVYAPKDVSIGVVEQGFSVIPKAAPTVAAEESKPTRTRRPSRTAKPKPPKRDQVSDDAAKRAAELKKLLGDSEDVFGTGKK